MKILVAARHLRLDRGSEGICSSKFVLALAHAGYDVTCLTGEDLSDVLSSCGRAPWLDSVEMRFVWDTGNAAVRDHYSLESHGAIYQYLDRRINSLWAYASGHHLRTWHEVKRWQDALRQSIDSIRPDIVFIRGGGQGFEPHMAMSRIRCQVPWVANYHDPYPLSLYPEPYRQRTALVSRAQEAEHRRIVRKADAVTFPSQRLLRWVLQGSLASCRGKAFVIPHVANGSLDSNAEPDWTGLQKFSKDDFLIVHTGTLLGGRDPMGLLHGYMQFIGQDPERRRRAKLLFVGNVTAKHAQSRQWQEAIENEHVVVVDDRLSYQQSLQVMRRATACIVLEASAAESPFFPAKLTDCLWLEKPILALSPHQSTVADMLGESYPLLVRADDKPGIQTALETLWTHWKQGQLADLVPAREIVAGISEAATVATLEPIFDYLQLTRAETPRALGDAPPVPLPTCAL